MTRAYAALRLLEHGPLTFRDFVEITGWPAMECRWTWRYLAEAGYATTIEIDGRRAMVAA